MNFNLSQKHLTFIFRGALAVFVIYLILDGWGISLTPCDMDADLLIPTSAWRIAKASVPAEILWQKAEPVSRPITHFLSPMSGMAISESNVLYWQNSGSESCDKSPIVSAFDLISGREQWRFRPNRLEPSLFSTNSGYILVNPYSFVMLDHAGKELWRKDANETRLPLRSLIMMYETRDGLYFSARSSELYHVSPQTGELLEIIETGNVVGVFDDFVLIQTTANQIRLARLDNLSQEIYTIQFPASRFQQTRLNPLFPFTKRWKDILLFYFNSVSVEAYKFDTGEALWKVEKPLYGIPVLLDDLLILYSLDTGLEIRDIETGELLGEVQLIRTSDVINSEVESSSNSDPRFSIWITGYDDIVVIRQRDTLELLAVRLDLSSFAQE